LGGRRAKSYRYSATPDLRDIRQLVNHRLNDGAPSCQEFVVPAHPLIFHIPLRFGEEFNAKVLQPFLGKRLERRYSK